MLCFFFFFLIPIVLWFLCGSNQIRDFRRVYFPENGHSSISSAACLSGNWATLPSQGRVFFLPLWIWMGLCDCLPEWRWRRHCNFQNLVIESELTSAGLSGTLSLGTQLLCPRKAQGARRCPGQSMYHQLPAMWSNEPQINHPAVSCLNSWSIINACLMQLSFRVIF